MIASTPSKKYFARVIASDLKSFLQLRDHDLDVFRPTVERSEQGEFSMESLYRCQAVRMPEATAQNLRTYLGAFGFSGAATEGQDEALQRRERTRSGVRDLLVAPHNVLSLDKPTNTCTCRAAMPATDAPR
jgi:ATPase subunit of ABC transporter with duplicated ATPase domains